MKTENRGGKRPNSGRKKSDHESKTISFRIRPEWETEMKAIFNQFKQSKMKTTILSIALALTLFSCSTPDCETQLIELEQKRSEAMGRCGGSWGCYEKIQSDYDHKRQEILNDCK